MAARIHRTGDIPARIALASTDPEVLATVSRATGEPLLAGVPGLRRTAGEAVSAVLEAAFSLLPEPLRSTAPLYVLCDDYSVFAARRLVERCHDRERRLRPSDSVRPETSELVRPYLTAAGHRGNCYLLAGVPAQSVLRLAATADHPAAVICEPAVLAGDDPLAPGSLAVAAVWGAGSPPALPPDTVATPSALLTALSSTERQWAHA